MVNLVELASVGLRQPNEFQDYLLSMGVRRWEMKAKDRDVWQKLVKEDRDYEDCGSIGRQMVESLSEVLRQFPLPVISSFIGSIN